MTAPSPGDQSTSASKHSSNPAGLITSSIRAGSGPAFHITYLVRLFAGKPARAADLPSFLSSAQLVAADAFTVRAALSLGEADAAGSPTTFGSKAYLALRDAARGAVAKVTLSDFRDLLPAVLVAGLPANDTFFRFPEIVTLPRTRCRRAPRGSS